MLNIFKINLFIFKKKITYFDFKLNILEEKKKKKRAFDLFSFF